MSQYRSACYAVGGRAIVPIVRGAAGAAQALASGSSLLNIACADSETCDAVGSILSGSAGVFVQNGLIVPISAGTVGSAQTLAATAGLNEIGFTAIGCASSSTCYAAGRDQFCNERCQLPAVLVIISH